MARSLKIDAGYEAVLSPQWVTDSRGPHPLPSGHSQDRASATSFAAAWSAALVPSIITRIRSRSRGPA